MQIYLPTSLDAVKFKYIYNESIRSVVKWQDMSKANMKGDFD